MNNWGASCYSQESLQNQEYFQERLKERDKTLPKEYFGKNGPNKDVVPMWAAYIDFFRKIFNENKHKAALFTETQLQDIAAVPELNFLRGGMIVEASVGQMQSAIRQLEEARRGIEAGTNDVVGAANVFEPRATACINRFQALNRTLDLEMTRFLKNQKAMMEILDESKLDKQLAKLERMISLAERAEKLGLNPGYPVFSESILNLGVGAEMRDNRKEEGEEDD